MLSDSIAALSLRRRTPLENLPAQTTEPTYGRGSPVPQAQSWHGQRPAAATNTDASNATPGVVGATNLRHTYSSPVPRLSSSRDQELPPIRELSLSDAPDEDVLRRWLPSEEEVAYILKESHHASVHDFKEYYRLISTCLIVDPSLASATPSSTPTDPLTIVTRMNTDNLQEKLLRVNQELWTFGSPHRPLRRRRIFASLPDAIKHAREGDFIYLHKGVYTDPLTITKCIRLCGQMRINDSIFLQAQFQTTIHWRAAPVLRAFHTDPSHPPHSGSSHSNIANSIGSGLYAIAEEQSKRSASNSLNTSSNSISSNGSSSTNSLGSTHSTPLSPRSQPQYLMTEPLIRGSISCIDFPSELTNGEPSLIVHPRAGVDVHHSLFRNHRGTAVRICPYASVQLLRTSFSGNVLPLDLSPQCTSLGLYKNIYKDPMNAEAVGMVFEQAIRHARAVVLSDVSGPPCVEVQFFSEAVLSFVDLVLVKETKERAVSMLVPGLISQVLAVLHHAGKYLPLAQNLAAALNVFSKVDIARAYINSQNGLKVIHKLLQIHEHDIFTQSEGISTIWHLATQEGLRSLVESISLEDIIFRALSKFSHRTSLVSVALGALWNLSWLSDRLSDRIASHIEELVALQKLHLASEPIQSNLCGLMWNMSTHPALSAQLVKHGATLAVTNAMARHKNSTKLFRTACSLLNSLLAHPDQRKIFAEAGGVALLVEALDSFSSSVPELFDAIDSLFSVLWEGYNCTADFELCNGVLATLKAFYLYFGAQRSAASARAGFGAVAPHYTPSNISHMASIATRDAQTPPRATQRVIPTPTGTPTGLAPSTPTPLDTPSSTPQKPTGTPNTTTVPIQTTVQTARRIPKPLSDMKLFSFCVQRKVDIHLLLSTLNYAAGFKSTRVQRLVQVEFQPDEEVFEQLQLILKNSEPAYLNLFIATILKLLLQKDPSRLFAVRGGAIDLLTHLTSSLLPKNTAPPSASALLSGLSTASPSANASVNATSAPALGTNTVIFSAAPSAHASPSSAAQPLATPSSATFASFGSAPGLASKMESEKDRNAGSTSSNASSSPTASSPTSSRRALHQQVPSPNMGRNRLKTATRGAPPSASSSATPNGLSSPTSSPSLDRAFSHALATGNAAITPGESSVGQVSSGGSSRPASLSRLTEGTPLPTSLSNLSIQQPRLTHAEQMSVELARMIFDCFASLASMFDTDSRSGRLNMSAYSELLVALEHLAQVTQMLPFMSRRLLNWIKDRRASLLAFSELKAKQEISTFVPDSASTANRRFIALKLSNSWLIESPAIPLVSEPTAAVFLDTKFRTRSMLVQSDYATIWNPHGSMESIRANHFFPTSAGQVYFEVELNRLDGPSHRRAAEVSRAPFLAGWCTARAVYYSAKMGAGNVPHSWAVNPLLQPSYLDHHMWTPGDRLLCYLDLVRMQMSYGINGSWLPPSFCDFHRSFDASLDIGYAPVITLYQGTEARFIFGDECQFQPPSQS
jgi:hypothetical protein